MSQDQERIPTNRVAELLFTDSGRTFSDLKSRQWTATNLSVIAIMRLAALATKSSGTMPPIVATVLMFLIAVCHEIVTAKCSKNLEVFRARIIALIDPYFSKETHELFGGKEGFRSAVVDEGRITFILYASTPVTLVCALFVVWSR
jgi:hypothetical protein